MVVLTMNAKLADQTVMRLALAINQPISRGLDKAINKCLDELDELRSIIEESNS